MTACLLVCLFKGAVKARDLRLLYYLTDPNWFFVIDYEDDEVTLSGDTPTSHSSISRRLK
jgi:hypothetical protein